MGILDAKVAIVTGAGQGVGEGIALAMAKEGAAVVCAGRTFAKVENTCRQIEAVGGRALAIECDVKRQADVTRTVVSAVDAFGGIDILINNAQEVPLGTLLELADETFVAGFDSGPLATFRFMRACYPHMRRRGGGAIVNLVTAAAVRWDMRGYGGHAATKQAIRSLTRAAAGEWGPDNIRVNNVAPEALSPGYAWWMQNFPEEAQAFVETIPLGRVGDCEKDIGRAVVFMVGPDAGYLSGATIPLDGAQAYFD